MCFDSTTSLVTFSMATASSLYLYFKGLKNNNKSDKFISLIVMLIGFMQLIEYFLWKNQSCNNTNHVFSLLILILLTLQPILGSNYYNYLFYKKIDSRIYMTIFYSICYLCFGIYLLYWLNGEKLCSIPKKSCRLSWASMKKLSTNKLLSIIWFILYFFPFFVLMYDFATWNKTVFIKSPIRYLFLPISFFLTIIYILNKSSNIIEFIKNPTMIIDYVDIWGSVWCLGAVLLGIIGIMEI